MDYSVFDAAVLQYDDYLAQQLDLPNIFHRAAIWGNGGEESAGFTQMHQKGGNGRGGWQWDDRRKTYEAFCAANGADPDSVRGSVWFLVYELQTTEKHSLEQLKKTTALDSATFTFAKLFERPGVLAEDVRLRWAQRAYNLITEKKGNPMADPNPPAAIVPAPITPTEPVDQLAQFIKNAELSIEDVIRGLLISKGVPSFLIDIVFAQINKIDLADMIRHIDLNALLAGIFQQRK